MTVVNDISNELNNFEEILQDQKMKLDNFFNNWSDSSLNQSQSHIFEKKNDFDENFKKLTAHLSYLREAIFDGARRNRQHEAKVDILISSLLEDIYFLNKEFMDQNEAKINKILTVFDFELQTGLETLNYVHDLLAE